MDFFFFLIFWVLKCVLGKSVTGQFWICEWERLMCLLSIQNCILLGRDCAGACWPFAEIWCHWWLVQESAWLYPADTTPPTCPWIQSLSTYSPTHPPSIPLHFCSHLSVRVAIPTTLNICAIKSQMMPPCIVAYDVFGMWLCDVLACECAKQVCVWVRVWCVCFISVLLCPLGIFAHNRFRPVTQAAVIRIRPILGCKI